MLLLLLAVLAVIGVVVVLAVGRGERLGAGLPDAPPDRAPAGALPDGAVRPEDVVGVRFTTALRGYRMAEVDAVLDRLTAELAARDERIARLEDPADRDPADRDRGDRDRADRDRGDRRGSAVTDDPERG